MVAQSRLIGGARSKGKPNSVLCITAKVLALIAAVTLLFAPGARADGFTVTLAQVGSNVVATGSGAINLTGLSLVYQPSYCSDIIAPYRGQILMGLGPECDVYGGVSGPANSGSGSYTLASTSSGTLAGVNGAYYYLYLSSAYLSDTPLSATATWDNATFSTLGVTPGTYVWTWGTGANQEFTLMAGVSPVPEPSSLLLLGSGALGLLGMIRKKKCK